MMQFMEQEIDVLVSTTIIETGLDIPNVNTMIIHDARPAGAFPAISAQGACRTLQPERICIFNVQKGHFIKRDSGKKTPGDPGIYGPGIGIQDRHAGSGDPGAGNLLGEEQSGHMEAVGYDLYCKMLNDAVLRLKGELSEEY